MQVVEIIDETASYSPDDDRDDSDYREEDDESDEDEVALSIEEGKMPVEYEPSPGSIPIPPFIRRRFSIASFDEHYPLKCDEDCVSYTPIDTWTVARVCKFVEGEVKCPQLVPLFRKNLIDGGALIALSLEDLAGMGIGPEERRKMEVHISNLKRKEFLRGRKEEYLAKKRKREEEIQEAEKRRKIMAENDQRRFFAQVYTPNTTATYSPQRHQTAPFIGPPRPPGTLPIGRTYVINQAVEPVKGNPTRLNYAAIKNRALNPFNSFRLNPGERTTQGVFTEVKPSMLVAKEKKKKILSIPYAGNGIRKRTLPSLILPSIRKTFPEIKFSPKDSQ